MPRELGPSNLRAQAAEFYASEPLRPSAVHEALAQLPFPLIISTCHDRLLAQALKHANKAPVVYRYNFRGDKRANPEFRLPSGEGALVVYHLFGSCDEPQSLVLSENDLLDFLVAVISGGSPMPNSLRAALQQSDINFLFVGFGIRHWYLRVLLKALIRSLSLGRSGSAVALEPLLQTTPKFDRQQTILFYQRGTRIEVCDDDISSFVAELSAGLMPRVG